MNDTKDDSHGARPGIRVLTGDRPTGPLHLGHYFGTLANRVRLQREGADLLVVVADFQVITDRELPTEIDSLTTGLVLDYLSCGLDPDATTIFAHSCVPALNQLLLPFLSLVSTSELERNPTVKEEVRLSGRSSVSGLMLAYPVHQAADILFCKAQLVPVGKDQLPHLELTRSIARRFNERYGPVFGLPDALLGEAPVLAGLDGRKMSKSLGNAIALTDSPDVVAAKVRGAKTDADRSIAFDPIARPDIANLLTLAGLCLGQQPETIADELGSSSSSGGAAQLKRVVTDAVNDFLAPIRGRRAELSSHDALDILDRGAERAAMIADDTLAEVREAMGMSYRRQSLSQPRTSVRAALIGG